MDSCHLFNFLFDTKKAKSELTKCFTAFRDKVAKESQMGAANSRSGKGPRKQSNSANHNVATSSSTPSSPLKQFRVKISNSFSTSITNIEATTANKNANYDNQQDAKIRLISECSKEQHLDEERIPGDINNNINNGNDDIDFNDLSNVFKFDQPDSIHSDCCATTSIASPPSNLRHQHEQSDHSQDECSGTYRANLVQSVSFDRDGGIIIRDPAPTQQTNTIADSYATTSGVVCLDSKQLRNHYHNESSSAENSLDLTTLQSIRLASIDGCHDDRVKQVGGVNEDAQPQESMVKRVILYAGSEQLSDDDYQTPNVCSTAEVFNIINTNYKYDSDMINYEDDSESNQSHRKKQPQGTRSARTSFKERGRSSSLVRTLVQSFEDRTSPNQSLDLPDSPRASFKAVASPSIGAKSQHVHENNDNNGSAPTSNAKPFSLVKPLPPKAPPKTRRAKCLTMQLSLEKPNKIDKLFSSEDFLRRFFAFLEPLDRCRAAQVNNQWRNIIYAMPSLWFDLTLVIDYCQLRRDLVLDCIISTLSSAKLASNNKHQQSRNAGCQHNSPNINNVPQQGGNMRPSNADHSLYEATTCSTATTTTNTNSNDLTTVSSSRESSPSLSELDLDDVWRIQELCNRLASRPAPVAAAAADQSTSLTTNNQQQQFTSQSCSIPSQISSTLSSTSLSSLLSPPTLTTDGTQRMEVAREKLYDSIRRRQFDSICLMGANNDDLDEFLAKLGKESLGRVRSLKLRNTIVTDKGLTNFLAHFCHIRDLELILCNCISNQIELSPLKQLKTLTVQDCINITDDFAEYLVSIGSQLESLNIHAYHISDYFPDFLGANCDMSKLTRLKFPFCRELTDRSLMSVGKYYNSLEILDLSGTKISDDGVDFLANRAPTLKSLDLGWCAHITDASIDFLALDLSETLQELVLDRNIHITDRAMKQLVKMGQLRSLHLRWCQRITDLGIEHLMLIESLRYLSIAGLQQITSRSLLKLPQTKLLVLELTNCQAVNSDLLALLVDKMPNCNITY